MHEKLWCVGEQVKHENYFGIQRVDIKRVDKGQISTVKRKPSWSLAR